MSFKLLWTYSTNEEALEGAKRLEESGIECLLSKREKGLFGDPSTSDLIWLSVAESDYERAADELGVIREGTCDGRSGDHPPVVTAPDEEQGLMLKCPMCKSLNVTYDSFSFKPLFDRLFTMPWSKRRFFCADCRSIWD